jgi:thymidylate synthase (FAD) (EC 2.1.1.148)
MPLFENDNQKIITSAIKQKRSPINTWDSFTKATLISHSMPAEGMQELDSAQDLIAFCARVSNPSNQFNKETNEQLIKYLIKAQALVSFRDG